MKQLYYLILFVFLINITNTYCQDYDAKLLELYFANDADPEGFKKTGSGFYFLADDPLYGKELWFSDGTIVNTYLIKDIAEGDRDGNIQPLAVFGDLLFFNAMPNLRLENQLWVSDGTEEGTFKLKDYGASHDMFEYNGKMFFSSSSEAEESELWVSDGTIEGTKIFMDIIEGTQGSNPSAFFEFNDSLFFVADDGNTGKELWKSDGTPEGTSLLKNLNPDQGSLFRETPFLKFDGNFYFMATDAQYGQELFKSDGTEEGTIMVKDINPNGNGLYNFEATITQNGIFFIASQGQHQYELWKSDGTEEGTQMVKQLNAEEGAINPYRPGIITSLDNTVFFVADDGTNESNLWKTDGTENGTQLIDGVDGGSNLSGINNLKNIDGKIYFVAYNEDQQFSRIWTSDGTYEGTFSLSEVNILTNYSAFTFEIFGYNNKIYFTANSEVYGRELWVSDGTEEGTKLFKDFNHQWGSIPQNFTEVDGLLYFSARNVSNGNQLIVSNGTVEGTKMVKNINSEGYNSLNEESETIAMNNQLFFSANDGVHGFELWKSDGTESGTLMVKDIREGSKSSMYNEKFYKTFSVIGDKLFFMADDGVHGLELWVTDGTAQGTKLVKDINPGSQNSGAAKVVSLNNSIYFKANDGSGTGIWKTDGTESGTEKIKSLNDIRELKVVNNKLIIVAETSDTSYGPHDIWTSDGTEEGTVHLKSFGDGSDSYIRFMDILNDELYFVAKNPDSFKKAVYKTNGTTEGTILLYEDFIDIDIIRTCGDYVYFVIEKDNSYGGVELWRTTGSLESTVRVTNTEEGVYNYFESMACFQDEIYFLDAYNNQEIWRVDNNTGDTNKLSYTVDGNAPPEELVMNSIYGSENVLYFVGKTPESGDELYAIQNGPLAALPVDETPPESISTDIFTIQINNETCAGINNGSLSIASSEEHLFIASMDGNTYNFTQDLLVENLSAGDYSVCITMDSDAGFEQCFEFTVHPGGEMEGRMQSRKTPEGTWVNVNVEKGTAPFLAILDGEIIGRSNTKDFTVLANKKGKLEISSSKSCEGKMALDIETINSIVAFPNPTSTDLNIAIPDTDLNEVPVSIYNGSGQLISSNIYKLTKNILTIEVQNYTPGIYYAVLETETPHTIKFHKK